MTWRTVHEKLTVAQLSSLSFTEQTGSLLFSPQPDSHPLT